MAESAGNEADRDFGKLTETGTLVGGEHYALSGASGGGDDEVVNASLNAGTLNVGQQRGMMFRGGTVVEMDRDHREHFVEEGTLSGGAAGIGIQKRAGQIFGYGDRGDGDIVSVGQCCYVHLPTDAGDQHTGV